MMNKNIDDYLDDNQKGDFVEYCIYDYYKSLGYPVHIIKTQNEDGTESQRFNWNRNIVVPDLLIEDNSDELFFVEAKGFWRYAHLRYEYETYRIKRSLLKSYLSFYNDVFPQRKMEGYANVYVGFSDCIYDDALDGALFIYFVPFERLVDIDWFQEGIWVKWKKEDIEKQSTKKLKINFSYSRKNNVFSSKFTNNILHENRDILVVTKELIDDLIERWENQTWSWS